MPAKTWGFRVNWIALAAASVQYAVLPGSKKVEVKLFVAENVDFPGKE